MHIGGDCDELLAVASKYGQCWRLATVGDPVFFDAGLPVLGAKRLLISGNIPIVCYLHYDVRRSQQVSAIVAIGQSHISLGRRLLDGINDVGFHGKTGLLTGNTHAGQADGGDVEFVAPVVESSEDVDFDLVMKDRLARRLNPQVAINVIDSRVFWEFIGVKPASEGSEAGDALRNVDNVMIKQNCYHASYPELSRLFVTLQPLAACLSGSSGNVPVCR